MALGKYEKLVNLTDAEMKQIHEAKAKVKVNPYSMGLMVFGFLIMFLNLEQDMFGDFNGFFILGVLIIIASIALTVMLYSRKKKAYQLVVKELVVRKVFESQFEHVNYKPDKGLDQDYLASLEMYSDGNTFESNDLLMASYKKVGFTQADVSIQHVQHSGKTSTTYTYFIGRWLVCDFFKEFEGYHQIRSNGLFANKKPKRFFGKSVKEIDFESHEFNKRFTCYTTDEQEAYYLITPHYMEVMTKLVDHLNCEVVFGFINRKLHVAIYNERNAFEVSGDLNEHFMKSVMNDIDLIKYVIDGLHLDLDIFKVEDVWKQ